MYMCSFFYCLSPPLFLPSLPPISASLFYLPLSLPPSLPLPLPPLFPPSSPAMTPCHETNGGCGHTCVSRPGETEGEVEAACVRYNHVLNCCACACPLPPASPSSHSSPLPPPLLPRSLPYSLLPSLLFSLLLSLFPSLPPLPSPSVFSLLFLLSFPPSLPPSSHQCCSAPPNIHCHSSGLTGHHQLHCRHCHPSGRGQPKHHHGSPGPNNKHHLLGRQ